VKNDGSGISRNTFEPLSLSKAVLKAAAREVRKWSRGGFEAGYQAFDLVPFGGQIARLRWGIFGLAGGAAVGALVYFGLLAIPLRRLFTVTSWLILLLAAGMASQAAAFLMQANLLPSLGNDLWDTSSILSENSLIGLLLHVLIGYSAQPAGIQVVSPTRGQRLTVPERSRGTRKCNQGCG